MPSSKGRPPLNLGLGTPGPGCGTKSDEGARLSLLSTLLLGFLFVGQLCLLKMVQDTRKSGRVLRSVTKGGDLVGCKVVYKASRTQDNF